MTKPFTCHRCGNCCMLAFPGTKEDIEVIDKFLGKKVDIKKHYDTYKKGYETKCLFHDWEKGCTVYPVRPMVCAIFPILLGVEKCGYKVWDSDIVYDVIKEQCKEINARERPEDYGYQIERGKDYIRLYELEELTHKLRRPIVLLNLALPVLFISLLASSIAFEIGFWAVFAIIVYLLSIEFRIVVISGRIHAE